MVGAFGFGGVEGERDGFDGGFVEPIGREDGVVGVVHWVEGGVEIWEGVEVAGGGGVAAVAAAPPVGEAEDWGDEVAGD